MNQITDNRAFSLPADEAGFDLIEDRMRANVRVTIEAMFEEELAAFLGRLRYGRGDGPAKGYHHVEAPLALAHAGRMASMAARRSLLLFGRQ